MFNRFTSRALQVLFYARSQVSQLGSSAVEPEHILLGVLDEGKGLGSRILARTGGTLDDFRNDIVRRLTSREKISVSHGSARTLRFRAEGACEYAGNVHTAIARSGISYHAAAARDTDAHCAATERKV
jgi:ATP-dependent Clp protease ATP-binding subunit ClpA